jgi:hypothetical protein
MPPRSTAALRAPNAVSASLFAPLEAARPPAEIATPSPPASSEPTPVTDTSLVSPTAESLPASDTRGETIRERGAQTGAVNSYVLDHHCGHCGARLPRVPASEHGMHPAWRVYACACRKGSA